VNFLKSTAGLVLKNETGREHEKVHKRILTEAQSEKNKGMN
jgi:hypothetical protein